MKPYIFSALMAVAAFTAPAAAHSEELSVLREKTMSAVKARNEAYKARDYKAACEYSRTGLEQSELFMAQSKANYEAAAARPEIDRDLIRQAEENYNKQQALYVRNREMDVMICKKAGLPPAP